MCVEGNAKRPFREVLTSGFHNLFANQLFILSINVS